MRPHNQQIDGRQHNLFEIFNEFQLCPRIQNHKSKLAILPPPYNLAASPFKEGTELPTQN